MVEKIPYVGYDWDYRVQNRSLSSLDLKRPGFPDSSPDSYLSLNSTRRLSDLFFCSHLASISVYFANLQTSHQYT